MRAGFSYNTFPLMDGYLIPRGYSLLQPWIANLFENHAAVQFNHRLLAVTTLSFDIALLGGSQQPGVVRDRRHPRR